MDLIERNWLLYVVTVISEAMKAYYVNSNAQLSEFLRKRFTADASADYVSVTSKTIVTVGRKLYRAHYIVEYHADKTAYTIRLLDQGYMGGIVLTEDEQKFYS